MEYDFHEAVSKRNKAKYEIRRNFMAALFATLVTLMVRLIFSLDCSSVYTITCIAFLLASIDSIHPLVMLTKYKEP